MLTHPPLDKLGPEAATITADELAKLFAANSMRVHGFLRDQRMVAGIGRRLSNEICHRARISPFANTRKLGAVPRLATLNVEVPPGWSVKSMTLGGLDASDLAIDVAGEQGVPVTVVLTLVRAAGAGPARTDRPC